MLGYLFFRFLDKTQTPAVSRQTGERTDQEGSGVPERSQITGVTIEFPQALLAPSQMILFLRGGSQQMLSLPGISGDQGLAPVQGLGGDFTRVVNAHQPLG